MRPTPAASTTAAAPAAAAAASGIDPALSPNVMAMKITSRPSRKTPLKDTTNAYQSSPYRSPGAAVRAAACSVANTCSSSCSDFSPAERRIAFCSHCRPKISSSTPTTSCSDVLGNHCTSA